MRLFIRLQNGEPLGNPIFEDNFVAAFPDVDINNLPPEFSEFVRVPATVGKFEVHEGSSYERVGSVYTDVHRIRPMTPEERAAQIETTRPGPDWTWNEEKQLWNMPPMPNAGGPWHFDLLQKKWVAVDTPPKKGWILNAAGTRYVPPFPPPPGPWPENIGYSWDEETETWKSVEFNE